MRIGTKNYDNRHSVTDEWYSRHKTIKRTQHNQNDDNAAAGRAVPSRAIFMSRAREPIANRAEPSRAGLGADDSCKNLRQLSEQLTLTGQPGPLLHADVASPQETGTVLYQYKKQDD